MGDQLLLFIGGTSHDDGPALVQTPLLCADAVQRILMWRPQGTKHYRHYRQVPFYLSNLKVVFLWEPAAELLQSTFADLVRRLFVVGTGYGPVWVQNTRVVFVLLLWIGHLLWGPTITKENTTDTIPFVLILNKGSLPWRFSYDYGPVLAENTSVIIFVLLLCSGCMLLDPARTGSGT